MASGVDNGVEESKPEPRVGLLVTVALAAFFVTLAALGGRPDNQEQVQTAQVLDWVILGPLWAAVVYLLLGWTRLHRKKAVVIAIVVWVCVASLGNWWEIEKVARREKVQKLYMK